MEGRRFLRQLISSAREKRTPDIAFTDERRVHICVDLATPHQSDRGVERDRRPAQSIWNFTRGPSSVK